MREDKHKLTWRNCCDLSHAWTGLVKLTTGQREPYHKHTTPMFYYILQGQPIITLNGIKNRTKKWQCITIPSECPHAIDNDLEEDVIILWTYVSLTDKVTLTTTTKPQFNFYSVSSPLLCRAFNNFVRTNPIF